MNRGTGFACLLKFVADFAVNKNFDREERQEFAKSAKEIPGLKGN